jgi:hypothetical protein
MLRSHAHQEFTLIRELVDSKVTRDTAETNDTECANGDMARPGNGCETKILQPIGHTVGASEKLNGRNSIGGQSVLANDQHHDEDQISGQHVT